MNQDRDIALGFLIGVINNHWDTLTINEKTNVSEIIKKYLYPVTDERNPRIDA